MAESHRTQKEVGCKQHAFVSRSAIPCAKGNIIVQLHQHHQQIVCHVLERHITPWQKKFGATWQRSRMSYATALARAAPSMRHRQSPPRIDAASVGRQQPSRGSRPSPSSCPWLPRETRGVLRSQSSVLQQCAVRS